MMIGRCPTNVQAGQRSLPAPKATGTQRCVAKPRAPVGHGILTSPAPAHGSVAHQARRVHCAVTAGSAVASKPQAPEEEVVKVDSVRALEVMPGLHLLRGACNSRLKFEVEYNLRRGTTDNCYLLQAPGASVLVDIPFEAYGEQFVSVLKSLGPLKNLTHIVLTQLDPKNIPSLEAVLRAMLAEAGSSKQVQVVVSNPAARLLQSVLGDKPEKAELLSAMQVVVARTELKVPVGSEGRELELLLLPTPRWPDMLMAYDSGSRTIFSSKLFSAHVSPSVAETNEEAKGSVDSALDVGGWDAYGSDWRHFFECMVAPQARQALPALDKLDLMAVPAMGTVAVGSTGPSRAVDFGTELGLWLYRLVTGKKAPEPKLPSPAVVAAANAAAANAAASSGGRTVSYVLPMHGPVVANALAQLVREYRVWTEAQVEAASTSCAAVLYASAYGNTAALAQAISRGITKAGVAVDMLNLETENLDTVAKAISSGNGFIIGSPTLGGHMPTQVQVALGAIIRESNAKVLPCGVFGSFGWSGEAVDEMEQKLKDAGFGFAFDPIRVKFRPTAKDLQVCEESGRELALAIKRKLKAREASNSAGNCVKQAVASAPTLAMGRVVGSLSVLTAKDEDASSAMLASWVSQASFNPPGLTVAIKKDRAMESLLVVGSKFAMSMVPEGKDKVVMKKLARPFAPGEDRLAGLETLPGEVTGAPVLKDANAILECQVSSRMEAGDHWLVYATVLGGKVMDDAAPTAVHHRKVGNHY